MADELRMMMFEISGRAEVILTDEPKEPGRKEKILRDKVSTLNEKTGAIAERIEREVKKHMPPYVSVQATVQFESGSLILTGTVALLSWGMSIVFDAAKEEVERQLSGLIKASVQRAINYVFGTDGLNWVTPMEMTVRPSGPSTGSLFVRSPAPPMLGEQPRPEQGGRTMARLPISFRWLTGGVLFLLLIQVLLVLDRFFAVHLK